MSDPAHRNGRALGPEDGGCALVTGASRGLGAAIAKSLAAEGWPVVVNYRSDADAAASVVEAIEADGGRAMAVVGDVVAEGVIDEVFAAAEAAYGRVAILVNNAGMRTDGLSLQLSDDNWSDVLDTNLSAAFRTTRRALRPMIKARHGRIINIASIVGTKANVGQANYAASKAGLIGFTKTVAVEVARRGVTVNAVAPGLIRTDMTEGVAEGLESFIPARRAGSPEDVAACVRFLSSTGAAYVTGSVLTVDGGLSA